MSLYDKIQFGLAVAVMTILIGFAIYAILSQFLIGSQMQKTLTKIENDCGKLGEVREEYCRDTGDAYMKLMQKCQECGCINLNFSKEE